MERVDCRLQVVPIGMAQAPREQAACVVDVIALAKPGADDHGGDAGLFEHVPARDVGDRDAVTRANGRCRVQHPLQRLPAPNRADEAPVPHLRPRSGPFPIGLVAPEPALAEPASCERAVGQQMDTMGLAERRHLAPGALIEQRERHLVGDHLDSAGDDDAEVSGVDVGQAQMADQPLALEVLEENNASSQLGSA